MRNSKPTLVLGLCVLVAAACSSGSDASDGTGLAGQSAVTAGAGTTTVEPSAGGPSDTGGGGSEVAGAPPAPPAAGAGGMTPVPSGGGAGTSGAKSMGGSSPSSAGAPTMVTPYVPAWPCLNPTWPTATGTPVIINQTKNIKGVYDGKMALHDGGGSGDFGKDCSGSGQSGQGTTKPLFELEDGATIQNVIIGNHGADGIHCKGTCTIKNVWFNYVCDDAVTADSDSSGTVTVDGGGAKNAHDKLIQDNSHGKVVIQNFYGERLGKLYRACGTGGGCGSTKGNVTVTNITAVGINQIVGVTKGRDKATLSKICTFQTPTVCEVYDSSDESIGDGPDGTTCNYKWTDTQVLLNRVAGTFPTASECPNYLTSGSSTNPATMCIADLPICINGCLAGNNGLKTCDCAASGTYKCHGCSLPTQEPAKSAFSPAAALAAPACGSSVSKGKACSTEWQICKSGTQYCSCVFKPGTLQTANTVWDCVNPWF